MKKTFLLDANISKIKILDFQYLEFYLILDLFLIKLFYIIKIIRFRPNNIEFSPFYEPSSNFFIDFTFKFLETEKSQSELQ